METTPVCDLHYKVLTGPEFEDAICGNWSPQGTTPAWLASPRLKYYMRRSGLIREPDQRTFFMALGSRRVGEDGRTLQHAVGIVELQVSPYDDREVWLKYVTVESACQRMGVAKRLLAMMVEHLKANPRKLARSRASEVGAAGLQGYIDRLLDDAGIRWTQSGREERRQAA